MTAEPPVDLGTAVVADRPSFPRIDGPIAELGRWSAVLLAGLLWCAALLIGWRRLAGALKTPLDAPLLFAVGGLVAAVTVGLRVWWHRFPPEYKTSRRDWLAALLPSAAVLALGDALSLPGTTVGGLVALWAPLAGEELWAWRPAVWQRLRGRRNRQPTLRPPKTDPTEVPPLHPVSNLTADHVPAEDVLQQLTRSQAADGSERLSGWLRMPFAAGQRTANVHVAFCPPFANTPRLTVEQLDGPPARIKTAQLLPYGARLDLKLAAAAEDRQSVLMRFSARSKEE